MNFIILNHLGKHCGFTRRHSESVSRVSKEISKSYGFDQVMQTKIGIAGSIHDVGKLFIPNALLEKKEILLPEEYLHIKDHSFYTYVILRLIPGLGDITQWAANHHERLDGSGYPFGLYAEDLDIPSRIISVADVFSALIETRPYKKGYTCNDVLSILQHEVLCFHLDKDIIDIVSENVLVLKSLVRVY